MLKNIIKLMLAQKYTDQDPSGMLMSEKYDGIRAVWNGENFKSKKGKLLAAPDWFKKGMPKNQVIDGELWAGYGNLQKTISITGSKSADWTQIKFVAFDLINKEICEVRVNQLFNKKIVLPEHCIVPTHFKCLNKANLNNFLKDIIDRGGEGVILRAAQAKYQHNRTNDLLKLKPRQTDEAIVIGYNDELKEFTGMIDSLICEYKGLKINISSGLTNEQKRNPPKIGENITFSYFGFTDSGKVREAAFVAVRNYE